MAAFPPRRANAQVKASGGVIGEGRRGAAGAAGGGGGGGGGRRDAGGLLVFLLLPLDGLHPQSQHRPAPDAVGGEAAVVQQGFAVVEEGQAPAGGGNAGIVSVEEAGQPVDGEVAADADAIRRRLVVCVWRGGGNSVL